MYIYTYIYIDMYIESLLPSSLLQAMRAQGRLQLHLLRPMINGIFTSTLGKAVVVVVG